MAQFYYFRLYLGIETVSSRLLLWMERIDMEHETFWTTFNALPAIMTSPPSPTKKKKKKKAMMHLHEQANMNNYKKRPGTQLVKK